MAIHDIRCEFCGHIERDVNVNGHVIREGRLVGRPCVQCLQPECYTFYGLWDDVPLEDHGRSRSERADHNGFVKTWKAFDDPMCKIELGIHRKNHRDHTMQTFNEDQIVAFRSKMLVDGDTPQLRREILDTREHNLKKAEGKA
jgi:hypothetical protein